MRSSRNLAAILVLLATTQLPAQHLPHPPGSPPPPNCAKDLTTAQTDLARAQADLTKAQAQLADWPNLKRYAADDAALPAPTPGQPRVVFYGDSITDGWGRWADTGTFFPGKTNYINRGISGQTTPQMLVRFQQDVVHLHPAAVLILAGTNDVAGNTGPSTPEMTEDNFASMAAIARQNGIKVILASITPAYNYPWKPAIQPIPTIVAINQWLKAYCAKEGFTYLDYYSAMVDDKGAMKPGLAKDGVHPTSAGYDIMAPLAEAAITQAVQK